MADLTVRTDFAQVEADQEVVNVTRFSLFFPEKRQFFTESAGLFNYGKPGVETRRLRPRPAAALLQPAHRPLRRPRGPDPGGARVTGRVGPYSIGVLNIETDAVDTRLGAAAAARAAAPTTRSSA